MMTYTMLMTSKDEGVGLVRFNRPKVRNALNSTVLKELVDALSVWDADPAVGAIVITGDEYAFAAGADIKEMVNATPIDMLQIDYISLIDCLRGVRKPLIAAVSGWCLGGGNEIALACDMVIASESARFGQPEINLGVIPGAGGTQRLARAVGKVVAMEMVLNNRTLTAQEALHYGLVNRVVAVEHYLEEAKQLAREIATRAPLAVRFGKEAINRAFESFLAAFIEKRKPEWKGK
jgi:enoyl-CoA hydratase